MRLDDLAEPVVRFLGRILVELVLEVVCYHVGLVTLRVVSAGRYPPRVLSERQIQIAQVVGVFVLLAAGIVAWQLWPATSAG